MKITFLGTGAADWNWRDFPRGTRYSTCTLLGTSCMIDAGQCALKALAAAHVAPSRISDLLVTHSHPDHFNTAAVAKIGCAGKRRMRVWAAQPIIDELGVTLADSGADFDLRPLAPGDRFRVAGMEAIALPSNHCGSLASDEQTLHFAFSGRGIRLLYALDGGWMCNRAEILLKKFLEGARLSAVIWDATCGATFSDVRFSSHNDLNMIAAMRKAMVNDNLAEPDALHVLDHISQTLWPTSAAARRRLAARFSAMLAEDGMTINLGR